ncbi:MAG: radical SAM protein [Candidatus Pacearchaeota archaeon]|jgi:sulfatase maturation enzyme AslB (radical SAM superfamily)
MINTFLIDNCTYNGCNKQCSYCRPQFIGKGNKNFVSESISILSTSVKPEIIKISGYGELTFMPGWKEKIVDLDYSFKRVQLITNGTILNNKDLDFLKDHEVYLCFSLDGVTFKSNSARNSSSAELRKIMENIVYASSIDIPLEINTVLTKSNINDLERLLDFVDKVNGVCYPFPIRENRLYGSGKNMFPLKKDIETNLMDLKQKHPHSTPPIQYIESLMDFMLESKRSICYVPLNVLGVSPEGDLLKCPCSGTRVLANIFEKEGFEKFNSSKSIGGYDPECKDCFTHYEVINLFIDGKISAEEMNHLPLFENLDISKLKK